MWKDWNSRRSGVCADELSAKSVTNFLPGTCCARHKKHHRREPGLFKEEFRCTEMICLCCKTYCCKNSQTNNFKFISKSFKKRTLEDCGECPFSNYGKVLEEVVNVTTTNRGFWAIQLAVATHEQTKERLSYFYSKQTSIKLEYTLVSLIKTKDSVKYCFNTRRWKFSIASIIIITWTFQLNMLTLKSIFLHSVKSQHCVQA